MNQDLITAFRRSLEAISAPRFFETERGFQGQLLIQLSNRLQLEARSIIEQEYQKSLTRHGLAIRPDIIIHEPFDPSRHLNRAQGNLAVVELKLTATEAEARSDFDSLMQMLEVLKYPIAFFVNIGSHDTFARLIPSEAAGRIIAFAVFLEEGETRVVVEY